MKRREKQGRRFIRIALSMMILGIWIFIIGEACANEGPGTRLFEAIQNGQDVQLTVGLINKNQEISIKRFGESYDKVVVNESAIAEGSIAEPYCWGSEGECTVEDDCFDCDGDGIGECWVECTNFYFVEIVDECVMPGETQYQAYNGGVETDSYDSSIWIDVEDTGDDCNYYKSEETGFEGCAMCAIGSEDGEATIVVMLMILVGLVSVIRKKA